MVNKLISKKHKIELIFIITSIIFGLLFLFSKYFGDDTNTIGISLNQLLIRSLEMYFTWSSRVLLQAIRFVVSKAGTFCFSFFMAFLMYINLKSLYLLVNDGEESLKIAVICVVLSLLLPFYSLCTAGWICTSVHYMLPGSLFLLSLIPIKYYLDNREMNLSILIICLLSLIITCFSELACSVLLIIYVVAFIYSVIKKRTSLLLFIFLIVCLVFVFYALTCPGNYVRKSKEIVTWYPTFKSLSFIDKIDLGLSTTFRWMYSDNNMLIIFLYLCTSFLVIIKHKNMIIRLFSLIPTLIVVSMSVLSCLTKLLNLNIFLSFVNKPINTYGMFNLVDFSVLNIIQFGLYMMLALSFINTILQLSNNSEDAIFDITIVVAGFCSRIAMGFSPTVFASSTRTFFLFLYV